MSPEIIGLLFGGLGVALGAAAAGWAFWSRERALRKADNLANSLTIAKRDAALLQAEINAAHDTEARREAEIETLEEAVRARDASMEEIVAAARRGDAVGGMQLQHAIDAASHLRRPAVHSGERPAAPVRPVRGDPADQEREG